MRHESHSRGQADSTDARGRRPAGARGPGAVKSCSGHHTSGVVAPLESPRRRSQLHHARSSCWSECTPALVVPPGADCRTCLPAIGARHRRDAPPAAATRCSRRWCTRHVPVRRRRAQHWQRDRRRGAFVSASGWRPVDALRTMVRRVQRRCPQRHQMVADHGRWLRGQCARPQRRAERSRVSCICLHGRFQGGCLAARPDTRTSPLRQLGLAQCDGSATSKFAPG